MEPISAARRLVAAPIWAHAAALLVVLCAVLPIIGTTSQFSADEGAAIAQAVNLERGDGWAIPHPFRVADPTGDAFPLELSTRAGDKFAPYAKHPIYPAMLAVAFRVAGRAGMVFLSIAGTVLAAVFTALLARRIDSSLAVPALWVVGIASPLFFDSYVVIAHTLGAACAAAAMLCALQIIHRPGARRWYFALLATITIGTMLRTEMLFLAIALSVGVVVVSRRRGPTSWRLVAVPLIGAAGGWLADRVLLEIVVSGATGSTPWVSQPSGGVVANRIVAFIVTWLLPSYAPGPGDVLLLVAVAAGAVAAVVARTRPTDLDGVRLFAAVAGLAGLMRLAFGPGPVPGLLVAFPLVAIGFAALGRRRLPTVASELYATTFVLFALAVLATQYGTGGSGEWGGRYFAIGLPLLVPLLVYGVHEGGRRVDRHTAVIAVAGLATLSLSMSVLAVVTLRHFHRETDALVSAVDVTASTHPASDGGNPVVISSSGAAARLAFTLLDRTRWLTVPSDQLDAYGRRVRDLTAGPVTFVTRDEDDVHRLDAVYRVETATKVAGDWIVVVLQPR
ncbi:MAG: hypothetical protein QOI95_3125 [Acidimicrobiaceae bacterium]